MKQIRSHRKQKPAALPAEAYDLLPRAQVTLTAETCWLTRFDAHGKANTTYPVRAQDVARAFNLFNTSTGILPPDVLFWTQVGNQARLGIWLPPARRALHFEIKRRETLRVPLPGLVFVGQGQRYSIFAVAERPTSTLTALFHAPLPNVNNNGLICAGTVKFPICASDTIHAAADLFFASAFNLDLAEGKFQDDYLEDDTAEQAWEDDPNETDDERAPRRRPRRPRTLLHFLKDLQARAEFPLAQLVVSQITLQKLVEED